LSIDHLTITGGLQSGGDEETPGNGGFGDGAGIESVGALSITDSTISNNRLLNNPAGFDHPRGAGIDATGGPVAIVRTVIEDNVIANAGSGRGAGLHAIDVDDLTITESTIRQNRIFGNEFSFNAWGGGIMLNASVAHIDRSTISGNRASVTDGPARGAGISALDSDLTITQSSMSGNQGGSDFGPVTEVMSIRGTLTVVGSTVVSDSPEVGLSATSGSISSSIVGVTCSGSFASGGWNIAGGWNSFAGYGCGFTQPSDLVGADPALGDLADNGGPTLTHLPQLGSPAIDRIPIGSPGLCDGTFVTDQRGEPRPAAAGCDVGSVEVQPYRGQPSGRWQR
jgi:Right handed beta helix region